ncbi:D-glycero-beta-D-manno-heptose 1-phosphate adenylyltransferase [Bacteroidetes/Chlorobi group bacterium MS-B_bin-24]|jgi:D-beta-D-heptose 7-phosphate kinase/D-beta-D-heptose 1-phosphate adenosyltransferase|nr:MAG: D-glycero-beta-D-manno-heptose 1-phosphate adenylyltransferase [Bacteroidetes/Chlorobi group bacterium MS-B_bin-24]
MIVDFNEIEKICNSLREQNKKIVFTNGCFDILHRGHIEYLTKAKEFGDVLIVGLNSDTSVQRLKGKDRPINSESDRARILDALKPVDYVVIFEEDTPLHLIQMVKPDVLVKGGDYKVEEIVGSEFVMSYGGKVEIIPFVEGKSTTKIIQKIKGEGK